MGGITDSVRVLCQHFRRLHNSIMNTKMTKQQCIERQTIKYNIETSSSCKFPVISKYSAESAHTTFFRTITKRWQTGKLPCALQAEIAESCWVPWKWSRQGVPTMEFTSGDKLLLPFPPLQCGQGFSQHENGRCVGELLRRHSGRKLHQVQYLLFITEFNGGGCMLLGIQW